ncbi:hypothetical protein DSO57_1024986 [Entomophthora muscae]|uniref:Uncharacterized protein n=1 Tax=Entomophthora muscae TaxID=34485 RepID=A0ACC2SFC3_9FUNG|nr:hypothetical protein DSO57_1024986 [Entomophthora muscae]
MHPVAGLLRYIPYNLILSRIITGRWGPAAGTLLLPPPNVNPVPANLGVFPTVSKVETFVPSQCPEFYTKGPLILSQCIFWKFHKTVSEASLVVNHQLYVDLGDDSSPHGDCFLLSDNFRHSYTREGCLIHLKGIAKTLGAEA